MVCQVCGGAVGMEQRFCSSCGTRVALEPPPLSDRRYSSYPPGFTGGATLPQSMAGAGRVERHVRTLGILWCVYGALRLISGLVGVLVLRTMSLRRFGGADWPFGGFHPSHPFPPHLVWMQALVPVIAVVTLLGTALAFATGYALLTRQSWGRTVAIVAAVLTLLKLPLGTALGVYTLWTLAPAASGAEYEASLAQPSVL